MFALAVPFALLVTPAAAPFPQPEPANMARRPSRHRGVSIPIPPAAAGPPPPRIAGPRGKGLPLIVIDPGHGGHDPGARNAHSALLEKDVTLALAQAIRAELLRPGRVRVALTRDDDRFLPLDERHEVAREMGAALFISIHADASDETHARGATVYTLGDTASDSEAGRLADRENRADLLNGTALSNESSAVSSILQDLMRRETLTASVRFAELLHREAAPLVLFRTPYHRRAGLIVLKSPETPSVLFETGYISNDADAAWLTSPEGRRKVAQGVAKAVAVFVARRNIANPAGPTP